MTRHRQCAVAAGAARLGAGRAAVVAAVRAVGGGLTGGVLGGLGLGLVLARAAVDIVGVGRLELGVSAYQRFSTRSRTRGTKGVNSLSTDCGLDLDGYVTVSPCDPPPAVRGGSRRLAGGGEPTCSRAPPRTYLPPPESAYGTSSHPGTAAAQSRRCSAPPPAVTTQSRSGQQVKGAGSHQDTLTPTRR